MRAFFGMIDGRKTHMGVIALTTLALLQSFGVAVPAWLWTVISGWTGMAVTHKADKSITATRRSVAATEAAKQEIAGLRYDIQMNQGSNGQVKG